MMKKILVINTKYKITGGEDSNILDEIKLLKKYYEVDYLQFDNSEKLNFSDLVAFFIHSNNKSNQITKEKLRTFKPDIVYVHNTWFKGNLGIFQILYKEGVKTLVKIHNFRYSCAKHYFASKHVKNNEVCPACDLDSKSLGLFNKYYEDSLIKSFLLIKYTKKLIKILKESNLKILTITNFHKKYLSNLKIDPKKIILYLNPIELIKKESIDYKEQSNYVVYAGRLSSDKGVKELIKSWNKAQVRGLQLKIIGTGPLEKELVSENDNSDILFLGYLDNETVKREIKNSRAVITATKMFEGQPRLLCEASSIGVPSIYPSFGGMDEFFPEEYSFSFEQFNYDDLILKIENLNNKEIIKKESIRVHSFISEKLNQTKLINIFNEVSDN